jgi:glutamate synthase domain-containing protein 2
MEQTPRKKIKDMTPEERRAYNREQARKYREENREMYNGYQKAYRSSTNDITKAKMRENINRWHQEHKEQIREYQRNYQKKRYQEMAALRESKKEENKPQEVTPIES